ncbi:MAG: hypothetical protein P0S96_06625 [Simkaniaceae bacterium]|nr:hypothetical protein [Candidatus Sacchlamyda saccharinae]
MRAILFSLCIFCHALNGAYVHRHTAAAQRGGMTFTGNTLGLSKQRNENRAGTSDAIGAYTTVDTSLQVSNFPPGTTLDYTKNSSSASLGIPPDSTILYAELVWFGSYGYFRNGEGEDPDIVLIPANGPVKMTTPLGETHQIISDPATRQNVQNGNPAITYSAGNYTRSQNVTELVQQAGGGTYTVGHIPSTISPLDNAHNAAGWALAVIYKNPNEEIQNMSLFVGCEQASTPEDPAEVSGFITPIEGELSGRLLVCAIEGDANKVGDHMAFGPTPNTMTYLSGPNNGINDFFASQINGNDGFIDTSGTFGHRNHVPPIRISAGRQGIDITNVDCSSTLVHGQTTAYAHGITNVGGEDFTINALGIQILVEAPLINPLKKVNGANSTSAEVGSTVTFSATLTNTGSVKAYDVMLKDDLEKALIPMPGSCKVNGIEIANPNYSRGVPIGDLDISESAEVCFDVLISKPPQTGNTYDNILSVDYTFKTEPFSLRNTIQDFQYQSFSNIVTVVLPQPYAPTSFTGHLKKCKFLNKNEYSFTSSWSPPQEAGVLFYRIYDQDKVIGEVDANAPLTFGACLKSKKQGKRIKIAAVYENFAESVHVSIQIVD